MLLVWLIFISYYTVHWHEGIFVFKIPDVMGAVLEGKQIDSEIIPYTYRLLSSFPGTPLSLFGDRVRLPHDRKEG